jgi:hypothetical protein
MNQSKINGCTSRVDFVKLDTKNTYLMYEDERHVVTGVGGVTLIQSEEY